MTFILLALLLALTIWMGFEIRHLRIRLEIKDRELESLRRKGSDFVANVSHELKTPLTSIKGFAETLKASAIDDRPKAIEFITRIEQNAERLSLLVNDILDLAKIESPNMYLEIEEFDPGEVLDELQKDFSLKLNERKQSLNVDLKTHKIKADRRLFYQALRNLIENAHRYCQEGAIIEVNCERASEEGRDFVRVSVSDNGPGIAPEDLPRIFERFYRADKSRNRLFGGTGLGLALVKHIMLSHDGLVKVSSEPLKGCRFSLFYPFAVNSRT